MRRGSDGAAVQPRVVPSAAAHKAVKAAFPGERSAKIAPSPGPPVAANHRSQALISHESLMTAENDPPTVDAGSPKVAMRRLCPLVVVLVVSGVIIVMGWHRQLSFETL